MFQERTFTATLCFATLQELSLIQPQRVIQCHELHMQDYLERDSKEMRDKLEREATELKGRMEKDTK